MTDAFEQEFRGFDRHRYPIWRDWLADAVAGRGARPSSSGCGGRRPRPPRRRAGLVIGHPIATVVTTSGSSSRCFSRFTLAGISLRAWGRTARGTRSLPSP